MSFDQNKLKEEHRMSKKLKVVLSGCGSMSNAWFRPAKTLNDIEFVGLVDIFPEAAEARKKEHGFDNAVVGSDLKAVIRETGADVVFDVTNPEAHYEVTMTALNNGCHILGEKPMADSMAHAREMVDTAKREKLTYAVIQNQRYNKDIIRFRNLVQSRKIGDITTVNADFFLGVHFSAGKDKQNFRDTMQHVLILDMAIHSFDQARFISGQDPVSVYCHEWNPRGSWYRHGASANCIFEMSDGVVFNYRGSWCSEGLNTSWECDWRVIGETGAAKWDGGEQAKAEAIQTAEGFVSERNAIEVPAAEEIRYRGHEGLIRDFINHIKGDGDLPQTVCTDNIKSLAMVHAAIKSAETGRKVSIEY
jgi:predicted dehydrogenase